MGTQEHCPERDCPMLGAEAVHVRAIHESLVALGRPGLVVRARRVPDGWIAEAVDSADVATLTTGPSPFGSRLDALGALASQAAEAALSASLYRFGARYGWRAALSVIERGLLGLSTTTRDPIERAWLQGLAQAAAAVRDSGPTARA